jgi:hypothetical protein
MFCADFTGILYDFLKIYGRECMGLAELCSASRLINAICFSDYSIQK